MSTGSESFHSSRAAAPVGAFPHARRVGDTLYLSGIGPREPGTNKIPEGIEAQCRAVFQNVKLVLEDAGARWEQLVDVTTYLTNMKDDFPIYNRLWAEYFPTQSPCRTTVEINCLPTPIAIELKCVAWLGK